MARLVSRRAGERESGPASFRSLKLVRCCSAFLFCWCLVEGEKKEKNVFFDIFSFLGRRCGAAAAGALGPSAKRPRSNYCAYHNFPILSINHHHPTTYYYYYYTHLPPHSFFSHPQKSSSISSQQSPIIKAGPARPCVCVCSLPFPSHSLTTHVY